MTAEMESQKRAGAERNGDRDVGKVLSEKGLCEDGQVVQGGDAVCGRSGKV